MNTFNAKQFCLFKNTLKRIHVFENNTNQFLSAKCGRVGVSLERYQSNNISLCIHVDSVTLFYAKFHHKSSNNSCSLVVYPDNNFASVLSCKNASLVDIMSIRKFSVPHTEIMLNYPLEEDQYFQMLTLNDLPTEEDINSIVNASNEILSGSDKFQAVYFGAGDCKLEESDYASVATEISLAMNKLVHTEKQRIEK